uniref:Gypsy retrotransposon integrase-like protein 1-like n=1 Tax=Saccoglossus kowalevskii TaxID=10224 RepID=A0ABM0M372_SACKO|nr:PREDICTED: gypsy retrotransposon integrase-like protein 1-like [Saccoglossus kowalevskii]
MQQADTSLKKYYKREPEVRGHHTTEFQVYGGMLYRVYRDRSVPGGKTVCQVVVPKLLRTRVMEIAHDSIFGGHMGIKKTEDRIVTSFYWPGLHQDVTSFRRSCDVCQKTVSKGSVVKAPLGKIPLIDMPFKRVAIDRVGPITPDSDGGHRYILTMVDYATRYPEVVPLKNIDTETVAEALIDFYSRLGVPEEVLSDMGTQFLTECMQEVS